MKKSLVLFMVVLAPLLASSGCKGRKKKGWHCVAFTYDGKRRIHCEPTRKECEQRRKEVKKVAKDLTACKWTSKVYCFDTGTEKNPKVCAPSMDNCTYERGQYAQALHVTGLKYSDCYRLGAKGKKEGKGKKAEQQGEKKENQPEGEGEGQGG